MIAYDRTLQPTAVRNLKRTVTDSAKIRRIKAESANFLWVIADTATYPESTRPVRYLEIWN